MIVSENPIPAGVVSTFFKIRGKLFAKAGKR